MARAADRDALEGHVRNDARGGRGRDAGVPDVHQHRYDDRRVADHRDPPAVRVLRRLVDGHDVHRDGASSQRAYAPAEWLGAGKAERQWKRKQERARRARRRPSSRTSSYRRADRKRSTQPSLRKAGNPLRGERQPGRRSVAAVAAAGSATGGRPRVRERRLPSSPRPTAKPAAMPVAMQAPTAQSRLPSRAHRARRGHKASNASHANGNRARPPLSRLRRKLGLRLKPRRTATSLKPRRLWLMTPSQRWPRPTDHQQRRDAAGAAEAEAAERNPRAKANKQQPTAQNLRPRPS